MCGLATNSFIPLGLGIILVTSFETLSWGSVLPDTFHTLWYIISHQPPQNRSFRKIEPKVTQLRYQNQVPRKGLKGGYQHTVTAFIRLTDLSLPTVKSLCHSDPKTLPPRFSPSVRMLFIMKIFQTFRKIERRRNEPTLLVQPLPVFFDVCVHFCCPPPPQYFKKFLTLCVILPLSTSICRSKGGAGREGERDP